MAKIDLMEEVLRVSGTVSQAKTEDEQTILLAGELTRIVEIVTREADVELREARAKLAEVERERAQLAALREEVESLCNTLLSGDTGCIEESIHYALEMKKGILTDTAAAADAFVARKQAEALESAADRWRAEWPQSECAIPESWLRARAAELRGKRPNPRRQA